MRAGIPAETVPGRTGAASTGYRCSVRCNEQQVRHATISAGASCLAASSQINYVGGSSNGLQRKVTGRGSAIASARLFRLTGEPVADFFDCRGERMAATDDSLLDS